MIDPVWASFSGPFSLGFTSSLGELLGLKGGQRVIVLGGWGWCLDTWAGATTYVYKRPLTLQVRAVSGKGRGQARGWSKVLFPWVFQFSCRFPEESLKSTLEPGLPHCWGYIFQDRKIVHFLLNRRLAWLITFNSWDICKLGHCLYS